MGDDNMNRFQKFYPRKKKLVVLHRPIIFVKIPEVFKGNPGDFGLMFVCLKRCFAFSNSP